MKRSEIVGCHRINVPGVFIYRQMVRAPDSYPILMPKFESSPARAYQAEGSNNNNTEKAFKPHPRHLRIISPDSSSRHTTNK